MIRPTVYISEPSEIDSKSLSILRSKYQLIEGDCEFKKNYSQAHSNLMIRKYKKVDEKAFEVFPNLQNVVRVGVGLDNIDLDICKSKNVKVFNSAGSNANAVSEYVIGSIIFSKRKLHLLCKNDLVSWNRFKFMGSEIKGKQIGLIGFGNIAQLVYKKLKGFDCEGFYVFDPYISKEAYAAENIIFTQNIDTLIKNSDIVSIHVPLSDETYHLIDFDSLSSFKRGSVLVNTSRGAVVSEKDVIRAMVEKDITYIADVFETEPKVRKSLVKSPNFIGTPHIASMTKEANFEMVKTAVNNFLEGRPVNL